MSVTARKQIKFKLALGSDIRRLKQPLRDMDELRSITKKVFGRDIDSEEQKYYYYDSDDDRINVSDDEDLESAIELCNKPWIKIHVENYDAKEDPFFKSNNSSQKAEIKTGASTELSKLEESKISKLMQSTKSEDDSIESNSEEDDELAIRLTTVKETVSVSEEDSEQEPDDELGEDIICSTEEVKINQRKYTEVGERPYELLEEKECKVSSRSIPRG